jgi:hypothetical protein
VAYSKSYWDITFSDLQEDDSILAWGRKILGEPQYTVSWEKFLAIS